MLTNTGDNDDADDAENSDTDSESESDDDDETERSIKKPKKAATANKSASKSGIYVPPKIKPVYYDGDDKQLDKDKKLFDRAKKRAIT